MKTEGKAVFNVGSAGCFSCKLAIEHAGRRIAGIEQIDFDITTHRISVVYDTDKQEALDQLKEIVRKIGYEATLLGNRNPGRKNDRNGKGEEK